MDVDALVALQADEIASEHGGQGACELGLADAHFALQQEGLAELQGQHDRRRQASIGNVVVLS